MTEPDFLARTRASYDAAAVDYVDYYRNELAAKPLDRALLGTFAELVRALDAGPVADIGCGAGRITAHLYNLGLPVFGIDLSPQMVAVAGATYPGPRFHEGSMTELDLADNSLGGIVAWYSIIHIPQEQLTDVLAGFHRVLAPGGYLQLAFQAGDGVVHREEAGGHKISLDFHRRRLDDVADALHRAGLAVHTRVLREPDTVGPFAEDTAQAYLLARKPG